MNGNTGKIYSDPVYKYYYVAKNEGNKLETSTAKDIAVQLHSNPKYYKVKGNTITILKDFKVKGNCIFSDSNCSTVLDLNGHTLNFTRDYMPVEYWRICGDTIEKKNQHLIINDSKGNGTIKDHSEYKFKIGRIPRITINNARFNTDDLSINVRHLTINDRFFESTTGVDDFYSKYDACVNGGIFKKICYFDDDINSVSLSRITFAVPEHTDKYAYMLKNYNLDISSLTKIKFI